jgi:hypothetical protein
MNDTIPFEYRLLTQAEVMEWLGVSEWTMRRLLKDQELEVVYTTGVKGKRFPARSVLAYLDRQRHRFATGELVPHASAWLPHDNGNPAYFKQAKRKASAATETSNPSEERFTQLILC